MTQGQDIDRPTREDHDRADITQILYRFCRGVDRGDVALLQSVFHEDATDDHGIWKGTGHEFGPWAVEAFRDSVTAHMITNVIIELQGNFADCESHCLAFSDDANTRLMVHSRNVDRFEKRDGVWKIAHRLVVFGAVRTDPPAPRPDFGPGVTWSARSAEDPVYQATLPSQQGPVS